MNGSAPGLEKDGCLILRHTVTNRSTHSPPLPRAPVFYLAPPSQHSWLCANPPAVTREGRSTQQISFSPLPDFLLSHVSDEVKALWLLMQADTSRLAGVFARVSDLVALRGLGLTQSLHPARVCATFECKSAKDITAACVTSGDEGLTGVQ